MRILLHMCCGPCTIYPLKVLREEGHQVRGFFFNPNIHPYREWVRRLDTLRQYLDGQGVPLWVDGEYDLYSYLQAVLPRAEAREKRCPECYRLRLEATARMAAEQGIEAFTTTLLVSPYQLHQSVLAAGRESRAKFGCVFIYRDFRPGWREAVAESRRLGMYRQPYCGCVFSERERYWKEQKRTRNAGGSGPEGEMEAWSS